MNRGLPSYAYSNWLVAEAALVQECTLQQQAKACISQIYEIIIWFRSLCLRIQQTPKMNIVIVDTSV